MKMTMREMADAFGVPYHTVVQAVRAQVPLERRTRAKHELFDAETVAEYLLRWCGRKQAETEARLEEILAQMRRIEAVANGEE